MIPFSSLDNLMFSIVSGRAQASHSTIQTYREFWAKVPRSMRSLRSIASRSLTPVLYPPKVDKASSLVSN